MNPNTTATNAIATHMINIGCWRVVVLWCARPFSVLFVSAYDELREAHDLKYSSLCYTTVILSATTGSIARILQFGGYERAE